MIAAVSLVSASRASGVTLLSTRPKRSVALLPAAQNVGASLTQKHASITVLVHASMSIYTSTCAYIEMSIYAQLNKDIHMYAWILSRHCCLQRARDPHSSFFIMCIEHTDVKHFSLIVSFRSDVMLCHVALHLVREQLQHVVVARTGRNSWSCVVGG